jgi:1-deoxy-D-xylulose-5-phosphate synthase
MDEQDLRDLMYTASLYDGGPFSIRYPRGSASGMKVRESFEKLQIGTGRKIADGSDVAIISIGAIGAYVQEARERLDQEGVGAAHYDLRFVKPLDDELLSEVGDRFDKVITIEDGVLDGGAGSAVLEWLADHGYSPHVVRMGLPDSFVEHGSQRELHDLLGIGPEGLYRTAMAAVGRPVAADGELVTDIPGT